ncbi:DNA mismatch repair protein MutS [Tenacibaculum sp. SG-28]|uniref:DNA mismatch repair protein MutS n=1 Tax=Tenacibaculum sp. SG-28 TaxID=754426 RepID=UPI000CF510EB|nr:DNA mismatch repair protein MutS [Tenacibaculum sp. SG-28]PQJ21837.1 DNA mismatch repair protein MutS [Tenacibaculum sp. SG-28]
MAKTKAKKITPLMQQYNGIKVKYPDAMLLFRVGDFYETFGEDAIKASEILGIILTKRGAGSESETALAGFPHHSLNTYLPKLVKAGLRVAICDQLEDPKMTKKIVKRGVTELVTPGVALNDDILQSKANNFLAAIHFGKKKLGISFLDVSTGEFLVAEGDSEYLDKLLQNFSPSEILVQKQHKQQFFELFPNTYHAFYLEDWIFQEDYGYESLSNHFRVKNLKGFGVEDLVHGVIAGGAIMYYLSQTQHKQLEHIQSISRIAEDRYVWMDRFTIKNLELYGGNSENSVSLLAVIDKTISPMGSRLLKRWLALPLKDLKAIQQRQEMVKFFIDQDSFLESVTYQLRQISDIERLISKVATGKVSPRETVLLKNSLQAILPIKDIAEKSKNIAVKGIGERINDCKNVIDRIAKTLYEDAPVHISKGNAIADGVSEELDALRAISNSGKEYLDAMLSRETERTGISSLKIAFNNVFGYYIEVRNTHKDKVPEEWIRKQTLVNAERYITEELKEYETKILGAEDKIQQLEAEIFSELIHYIINFVAPIQENAQLVAQIDCLLSFATLAIANNYVRPVVDMTTDIEIKNGRHPVIEKQLPIGEDYIANDVVLNRTQQQVIMITGPNMSGKSAILRQTALIVLLAQMGCYVPAQNARIGLVDKIFTRVGASDNISMGESTFMVEMNETASILNNISDRSLVLLDEIGRGTSTYDGISIAWAIAEYLHEHPTNAKTLFATHYHELNEMTTTFERIKNFNVSVKELDDSIIFLRKLVSGGSNHSFGIHVAKLAGMPSMVIRKANKILKQLEENHTQKEVKDTLKNVQSEDMQLSFFQLDDPLLEDLREEIVATNIDTLTPIEALMKLNEIKRMLVKK